MMIINHLGKDPTWWLIPRIVSEWINPNYKWINPIYPIYNWGYNPLTKSDEPPSSHLFAGAFALNDFFWQGFSEEWLLPWTGGCVSYDVSIARKWAWKWGLNANGNVERNILEHYGQPSNPRCSMYGICTYICPNNHPNVGKYTIHGASGKCGDSCSDLHFPSFSG